MNKFIISVLLSIAVFLSGCTEANTSGQSGNENKQLEIMTSFYPLYEIADRVGGPRVAVKNLVPAGVEPHDYEPTPQDILQLYRADLLILNGGGFEPWSEGILPELIKNGVKILSQSNLLKSETIESSHDEDGHEAEGHGPVDPHFWLDPVLYSKEIQAVENILSTLDEVNQAAYRQNAERFRAEISDLDRRYRDGLAACQKRKLVTSHNAFTYLARRYGLEIIPIAGLSPESEPSAKTLATLTQLVKENNIGYIFTESLLSPKTAQTLAGETGTQTLVLNPIEGLTEAEVAQGKNYLTIMDENLQNLRTALECR